MRQLSQPCFQPIKVSPTHWESLGRNPPMLRLSCTLNSAGGRFPSATWRSLTIKTHVFCFWSFPREGFRSDSQAEKEARQCNTFLLSFENSSNKILNFARSKKPCNVLLLLTVLKKRRVPSACHLPPEPGSPAVLRGAAEMEEAVWWPRGRVPVRSVGKETATTTVSVPPAAGAEAAREDRNRVGGPESSRAPCLGFWFFFFLFLKFGD